LDGNGTIVPGFYWGNHQASIVEGPDTINTVERVRMGFEGPCKAMGWRLEPHA
jgi:hypothetical protein